MSGTLCAALAFVLILHLHAYGDDPFALVAASVLFGFPIYGLLTTLPKGIILGKPHPKSMQGRVRHVQYKTAMKRDNTTR